ncbi:hypothetical protein C8R46DRAFT_990879 [Mycena filopes]|nr:hypothetical protein C8R46DRAFT_997331 [Mycena filopes]KAJ7174848.1 hypothetical protein C8R46DRAFT_990879 [Mycena filopes]
MEVSEQPLTALACPHPTTRLTSETAQDGTDRGPQGRLKPEAAREDRFKFDNLRGSSMAVGTMEEIIDDDHAIVSTAAGPKYYVSYFDKGPGCQVLLHHKTQAIIGVLNDTDPLVSIMKLDNAPLESYTDIGLEQHIQDIKESVELLSTHPECRDH